MKVFSIIHFSAPSSMCKIVHICVLPYNYPFSQNNKSLSKHLNVWLLASKEKNRKKLDLWMSSARDTKKQFSLLAEVVTAFSLTSSSKQGRTGLIIQAKNLMPVQAHLQIHPTHNRSHSVSIIFFLLLFIPVMPFAFNKKKNKGLPWLRQQRNKDLLFWSLCFALGMSSEFLLDVHFSSQSSCK